MMRTLLAGLILCVVGSAAFAADWAKVNGKAITDKDAQFLLGNLNEGQRSNVLKDSNSRREILVKLIDQELLVQEGEKEKLDQDQEYKDSMAAFRKQYLSSRVLQKNLASQLTDKATKKYYESHKNRFSTDRAHVQHILLEDEKTARDVLKKAKEPNADFQELAEKLSKDPSAKNNRGDVGVITRDSPFVPEFKDAVFAASSGTVIGPIKTAFGYHVIKVVEKKIGKPLEYDEVELKAKQELQQQLVNNYLGKLKEGAKIEVDEKVVQGK